MLRVYLLLVSSLFLFCFQGFGQVKYFANSHQTSFLESEKSGGVMLQVFNRNGASVFERFVEKSSGEVNTCTDVVCYEDGAVKRVVVYTNSNTTGEHGEERFFFDRSGDYYDHQELKDGIPVELLGGFQF